MAVATRVFQVNTYDFENIQRGVRVMLSGVNPWAPQTRIPDFYNPPFSILFLWPTLLAGPRTFLALGAAFLFGFVFYHRAWVALSWFATNYALWVIAAGGVDMFLMGAGLILLLVGDNNFTSRRGLAARVLAYGLLLVKPQGGVFVVALYVLSRFDWKAFLVSVLLYGLLFSPLYPAWINVIIHDPPLAQTEATHTIWARFGIIAALVIAAAVSLSRRWQYWQLGGALAGILTPYGMPGIPALLTLTAVKSLKAAPMVVVWGASLAVLTWVTPPSGIDFYDYLQPFMAIFHLTMLGLALVLACLAPDETGSSTIGVFDSIRSILGRGPNGGLAA